MIDFHIEIHEQMPPSSAMVYAKSMGLRAFALVLPVSHIPAVDIMDRMDSEEYGSSTEKSSSRIPEEIKNSAPVSHILTTKKLVHELSVYYDVQAFFGIKLMHIPPCLLERTVNFYRALDIALIGVHGETITDIVEQGTNFSAIMARADILFNPGLIDEKCAELAKENGVFLEISTNPRHSYTNAHTARLAAKHQAGLVLGSCAKKLEEIHNPDMQKAILKGSCVEQEHSCELLQKLNKKKTDK